MNMSLETIVMSLGFSHGALPDRVPFCWGPEDDRDGAPHHDTGWLVCHGDDVDDMSNLIRRELFCSSASLQSQCLRVLAKSLPLYVDQVGVTVMHSYMSTFPPWTLVALSMEASHQGSMSEEVAYVLGHHDFVDRMVIDMPTARLQKKVDLLSILHPSLRRLELGNMHLEARVLDEIFNEHCPLLTHLSIRNCKVGNHDDTLLYSLPESLQVLDLSDNEWVTNECLLDFLETKKHHARHLNYVNVAGCHHVSTYLLLRLNFDFRGQPLISLKRQRLMP